MDSNHSRRALWTGWLVVSLSAVSASPAPAQSSGSYIITTVAGLGNGGFSGDGGPALYAGLYFPAGVTADGFGNVFTADILNHRVREVTAQGTITTVAGNGTLGFGGDGGPATAAQVSLGYIGTQNEGSLNFSGLAVDPLGNLFIADTGNQRVRKVTPQGVISTVAGGGSSFGDGGPATSAYLEPVGIAVDTFGNLFIADSLSSRVREVNSQGVISTAAGGGSSSGDGGPATSAYLVPVGIAIDKLGNLFVSDSQNGRVRKVSSQGIISTVAGGGYGGDGGPATSAELIRPTGVAVDAFGNLFIAGEASVREVNPQGIINTVATGSEYGYGGLIGDGGPATAAVLGSPIAVAADASGDIFIADSSANKIRELVPSPASLAGCIYSLDQSSRNFGTAGGSNSVGVLTSGETCSWLAVSYAPWITISPAGLQSGIGLVNYTVSPNLYPSSQSGTIWIAGNTMTINQAAFVCSWSVSPSSVVIASSGVVGATLAVTTPSPYCGWNATANVSWILVGSGSTGEGSTNVSFTVGINTGGRRAGTMTVAGQTINVVQGAASCNLTGDQPTSAADVQLIINEALGEIAPSDDLNSDGVVNVADVQIVIESALTQTCAKS